MPAKRLTDSFIRTVRPPLKQAKPNQVAYIDTIQRGLALVLVVNYGGTKTFRILTYHNGTPRTHKLGTYPAMKLHVARRLAFDRWENPEKYEGQGKVGSFKVVAEAWIKRHVEAHGLRSRPEIERLLNRYVYPQWAHRPFLELRRRQANELLDNIVDAHGARTADATLAVLRGIMNWHEARDENYSTPIVKGMKRCKPKARDRILDDNEISALWATANGPFGDIVRLCLLTGQRREKVASMRWADLDDDTGVWTIPREEREKGTAGQLTLPRLALEIIAARPIIAGNPYVFASGPSVHFNSWSQHKAELDAKLIELLPDMKPWVVHDLRRTARSLMARADVRPDVAERVLGHAIPGVEGVYDRHLYTEHKADALTRLAALIDTILNPPEGNVVPMKKGRVS